MKEEEVNMDLIFNPNEFTEKELLKLVYRDLHQLKRDFEDYKKNNDFYTKFQMYEKELNGLKTQISNQEALRLDAEKRMKNFLVGGGLIIAAIDIILKLLI